MWIWFVLAPVAYYLPLLLHELCHLIAMKATGATITSFKPYWHIADGTFWFGRVTCVWSDRKIPDGYKYSHIAPLLKACFFFAVWLILGLVVWRPFLMFAFTEIVDAAWWFINMKTPGRDGYKWLHRND